MVCRLIPLVHAGGGIALHQQEPFWSNTLLHQGGIEAATANAYT